MQFDIDKAHDFIDKVIRSDVDFQTGITSLINYCESTNPSDIWQDIRKFHFANDIKGLKDWLEYLLTSESPSNNIVAFWFGLYYPIKNQKTSYGFYINGSVEFDTEDWACWTKDSYLPDNKYANSKILDKLYPIVGNGKSDVGEYVLCLGYTCLAIKEITRSINPKLLSGERKSRAIGIGFDSGDRFIRVL